MESASGPLPITAVVKLLGDVLQSEREKFIDASITKTALEVIRQGDSALGESLLELKQSVADNEVNIQIE